jgi:hypothetical protein
VAGAVAVERWGYGGVFGIGGGDDGGSGGGGARDTPIVFTKTVPSNSPGCAFEIGVVTSGKSGQFYSGPGGGDRVQHATRSGTVLVPTPAQLVTFIVHGLSDNPYSFLDLRDNLERTWAQQKRINRIVDVDFYFPGCFSIKAARPELAAHVGRFPFFAGDRIAFVAQYGVG